MAARRQGAYPFPGQQPLGQDEDQFDILEWYPHFHSCTRYFLEHAQFTGPVQALAAHINIQLPFQKPDNNLPQPFSRGSGAGSPAGLTPPSISLPQPPTGVPHSHHQLQISLQPYIRRLVVTGFDYPAVLHSFFGDAWKQGIGVIHEQERRNYLFAAKSGRWLEVKRAYDVGAGEGANGGGGAEGVPFLRPLRGVSEEEIVRAEEEWGEWLAMQDWMLGPRSLDADGYGAAQDVPSSGGIKMEDGE
ncbi:hypothetical protein VTI74DRAFT_2583 [Chaetomium olivicolor]